MKVLVLNCGSSSIKFQLINMEDESVLIKGIQERIGSEGAKLEIKQNGSKKILNLKASDHTEGIKNILSEIQKEEYNVLKSLNEIVGFGHRIVHGGDKLHETVLVNDFVKKEIKKASKLSPLHNLASLSGIEACEKAAPEMPNVAVFDTAFHYTLKPEAYLYNIPYQYYEKYKIRKYGFHGTSHKYVSEKISDKLGEKNLKIINCHLGQGASICAIENGKSVDTTMGLTPLDGIPMGTRSGSIDVAAVEFLCEKENMNIKQVLEILNQKSGVLGLSGISSDFRDIEREAAEGNEKAILALKSHAYKTAMAISSYMASLGGVDVISFTAGVGENQTGFREDICEYLKFAGVKLDKNKNKVRSEFKTISADDSVVKVMVVPTNEELVIARETKKIIK